VQVEIEVEKTIILTISEHEAEWLKGLMQNPINTDNVNEQERDRRMRSKFFNVLCYAEEDHKMNDI